MLPTMLDHDRKQAGWSVSQVAWRLGLSVREYRELEAGRSITDIRDVGPHLQAVGWPQTFAIEEAEAS